MSQRLKELKAELVKVFGRLTKWELRCKEQGATTDADRIKVAVQVLAEPCTGTIAEAHTHRLGLEGATTVDLNQFFGPQTAAAQSKPGKRP